MTDDKPKFTPGPWHKSTFEDDYAIRGAKCNRIIARPNCNFDDASANAALIAAAPEMYALLERLVLSDEEAMGEVLLKHWISEEIKSLLAKVRGER